MWLGEPPFVDLVSITVRLFRFGGAGGRGMDRVASPDLRGALPVDWPGCAVVVRSVFRSALLTGGRSGAGRSWLTRRPASNSQLRTGTDQGNPTV